MFCCAYSCTQYGLHTQYMLLTLADALLCLQLHTVRSPHTVHASNPYWCLAVPTAELCRVSTSFTVVRVSFEQTLYVSLTLLKYKFRSIFSRSQCNITPYCSHSQTTQFNLRAIKFPRPSRCEASDHSFACSLCVPYLSNISVTNLCNCSHGPSRDSAVGKAEWSWRVLRGHITKTASFEIVPSISMHAHTHTVSTGQTTDITSLWLRRTSRAKIREFLWRYINADVPGRRTGPSLFITAKNWFKLEVNSANVYSVSRNFDHWLRAYGWLLRWATRTNRVIINWMDRPVFCSSERKNVTRYLQSYGCHSTSTS